MTLSRRQAIRDRHTLRTKLEECQALLSALALAQGGTFTIPAAAITAMSEACAVEHLFALRRCAEGVIVEFVPTEGDARPSAVDPVEASQ